MLARLARPASRLASTTARAMSTAPFAVIVAVSIKPDRVPEFLEVMHADAKGSREEPGCLRFDLLKDEKDPNKFYFYEVYKNGGEAMDYHKSMDHYKAWTAFKESGGVVSQEAFKAAAIDYTKP
jgi:autoinducer 2-degrading protein